MFCRRLYPLKFRCRVRTKSSWTKPGGYDTGINIYNCVAKKKVSLISKQKGIITWYTCGPTVYDEPHVGHASCYLKVDIIQRILSKYFNYSLITAMNITDVDDKIIKRSIELNKSFNTITKLYEEQFWNDLAKLKILKPDITLRVSENISCIQGFIDSLITRDLAYRTEDGSVYFKLKGVENYGKLVNLRKGKDDESSNVNDTTLTDWVLWKTSKPNEPFWESAWCSGRPGWHVECSAMASRLFGSSLDIHAGGMDLKFPHHENEEAQSCAFHSKSQWVNYWLHIGQLHSKSSEKMSKSLKNTISINSLLEHANPDDFRLACLMSHYRSRMEYSQELLKMAARTLKKYRNFLKSCDDYCSKSTETISDESAVKYLLLESREDLHTALCNDFDTPEVINILNKIVKIVNPLLSSNTISISAVIGLKKFMQQIFNLFNISESEELDVVRDSNENELLDILRDFRQNIREIGLATKDKDILKLCDDLRSHLKSKGIQIRDVNKDKIRSS